MTTPSELSLEQKVDLLAGADTWHTVRLDDPRVPAIRTSDGPAGVRGTSWTGAASASFPCGAALGATWDPALVRRVGQALGREAHSKNAHVLLGPTVNLQRTPIGGRNFECMSEDPLLTAELAVAYVTGVQSEHVAACIKHLVGNDTEFERMTISSEVDERTLREVYLLPFEAAVKRAAVRAVMAGYNRLNGTFCSELPPAALATATTIDRSLDSSCRVARSDSIKYVPGERTIGNRSTRSFPSRPRNAANEIPPKTPSASTIRVRAGSKRGSAGSMRVS